MSRAERVRAAMDELGVNALLLSLGADLPWLTGYTAMPLERLTMLVLPANGEATLVVPRLEEPRVQPRPELFSVAAWDETDDPVAAVADLVGLLSHLAVSDRTWATFVLALQALLPGRRWSDASLVTAPLRARKDPDEVTALRRAAAAADRVATQLVGGNCDPLAPGHAFSVEPGIYVAGKWGARIEDIVLATSSGPDSLNQVSHDLAVVEA